MVKKFLVSSQFNPQQWLDGSIHREGWDRSFLEWFLYTDSL